MGCGGVCREAEVLSQMFGERLVVQAWNRFGVSVEGWRTGGFGRKGRLKVS